MNPLGCRSFAQRIKRKCRLSRCFQWRQGGHSGTHPPLLPKGLDFERKLRFDERERRYAGTEGRPLKRWIFNIIPPPGWCLAGRAKEAGGRFGEGPGLQKGAGALWRGECPALRGCWKQWSVRCRRQGWNLPSWGAPSQPAPGPCAPGCGAVPRRGSGLYPGGGRRQRDRLGKGDWVRAANEGDVWDFTILCARRSLPAGRRGADHCRGGQRDERFLGDYERGRLGEARLQQRSVPPQVLRVMDPGSP